MEMYIVITDGLSLKSDIRFMFMDMLPFDKKINKNATFNSKREDLLFTPQVTPGIPFHCSIGRGFVPIIYCSPGPRLLFQPSLTLQLLSYIHTTTWYTLYTSKI